MRLLGRFPVVLGLAAGLAVATPFVSLFGCGVDQVAHLPGMTDALPNQPGGAGFVGGSGNDGGTGSGGAGGSFGAGGSGGSSVIGPALTICDVAASAGVSASTCAACVGHTSGVPDPTGCETENLACSGDALCQAALTCIASCKAGANLDNCVVQCLDLSSTYQGLLQCMFGICNAACGRAMPLACNITDGG